MAMDQNSVENLKRIAKYLKVVCRKVKDKTLSGFATIISAMGRESKSNQFASSDLLTQTSVVQWFDYSVLYIGPATSSKHLTDLVLQELNEYLSQRSYLVGQTLTLADIVVFYSLTKIMSSLAPVDKDKYLNVSRWFEHLQNIGEVRQTLPIINLSTIYLHGWATGTHI